MDFKKKNIDNDGFSFSDGRSRDHHNICFSFSFKLFIYLFFYIIYQESLQLIGFFQENFEGLVGVD